MNERGAFVISQLAHQNQKYGEEDYFQAHILGVVMLVKNYLSNRNQLDTPKGLQIVIAAYLHDVIEDTEVTLDDLLALGMPMEVYYMVNALTRRKGEEYLAYIRRAKANKGAKIIKVCDLNFNLSRNPKESLIQRYNDALDIMAE